MEAPKLDLQRAALGDFDGCSRGVPAHRQRAPPFPPAISGTALRSSAARRLGSASRAPSWMQTRASCASNSARVRKAHVVGRDRGHAALAAPDPSPLRCRLPRPRGRCAAPRDRTGRRTTPASARGSAPPPRALPRASAWPMSPSAPPDSTISPSSVSALQPAAFQHRRAALLPLEKRAGHELRQMPVAHEILAEEHDARGRRALARLANPGVDADQRLDARGQRFLVELHHRKQIALIGERRRPACRAAATAAISSGTRTIPSTREYSVCSRRWTN